MWEAVNEEIGNKSDTKNDSSSDGSSNAGVKLVIAKDGSFTGEYKSEHYDKDRRVKLLY